MLLREQEQKIRQIVVRDRLPGCQIEGLKFRASREHLAELADIEVPVCECLARRSHGRLRPAKQRLLAAFPNLAA